MLEIVKAHGKVVSGRLQIQIDLKGDLPGHPFRGNQYSGGAGGQMAPDRDMGSGVASQQPKVSAKVSVPAKELKKLPKEQKQEIKETAKQVEQRLDQVASRCTKLTSKLPDSEMQVELKAESSWKTQYGMTTGQYNPDRSSAEVAGTGRPANSSSLKGGQVSLSQSAADIATHEFGHHVLDQMVKANVGETGRLVNIWKTTPKSQLKKISQYAADHPAEMFCEALLAYTHPSYGTKQGVKLPTVLEKYFKDIIG